MPLAIGLYGASYRLAGRSCSNSIVGTSINGAALILLALSAFEITLRQVMTPVAAILAALLSIVSLS